MNTSRLFVFLAGVAGFWVAQASAGAQADGAGQPASVLAVPSMAALKALGAKSSRPAAVTMLNYYVARRGGGGLFVWNGASTAAANDGTVVQPEGVTTGRWIREFSGTTIQVEWFGAKCDGAFDDTPALQAAINYAETAMPNGGVKLPAGDCKNTSPLRITAPINFGGSGINSTFLHGFGLPSGQYVIAIDGRAKPNLEGVAVENLTLLSNNGLPDLLQINRASNSRFINIGIRNARNGIVITGDRTFSNVYEQIAALAAISGSTILFEHYRGGGQHVFTGGSFGGSVGFAVSPDSEVTGISFVSPNFEGCTLAGLDIRGSVYGLSMVGPRTEANSGLAAFLIRPKMGSVVDGLSITGGNFSTHTEAYAIQLGGAGGSVRGINIAGNTARNYSASFVRLESEAGSGIIVGTVLENVPAVTNGVRPGILVLNNENQLGPLAPK